MGNLIGGMHLYTQILTGIDELDKQRKLIAKAFIIVLSHELALISAHDIIERLACKIALAHHRFVIFNTGNLPTFSHIIELLAEMFERYNLVSPPDCLL